jgi:ferredoxin-NADP reductase
LTNVDDSELPDFRSGQHLIVERPASINTRAMSRCYTLSNGPKQKPWRITVRRASNADESNSMSNWIHEELQVGYRLRVRGPRGSFILDKADSKKHVVFVAAGVGITPMASMLYDELNFARSRPKWLFYQVRTWDTAPLLMELVSAIESSNTCTAYIAASRDVAPTDSPMKHVKLLQGRFVPRTIFEAVGTFDVSVFLCGPCDWMLEMRQRMLELGVPQGQIHEEAFGAPEAVQAKAQSELKSSEESQFQYDVSFELSSKKAVSCGENKDLLTLAKANAIQIPASCRSGHCGTCAVKLLRGTVKYLREPQAEIVEGEILPCICYPTSDIAIQA